MLVFISISAYTCAYTQPGLVRIRYSNAVLDSVIKPMLELGPWLDLYVHSV